MDKNIRKFEEFEKLLAMMRKEHAEKGRFLSVAEQLAMQARADAICGSWIAIDSAYSLLVRRIGEKYFLLLCDNTHCYKSIEREMTAVMQRGHIVLDSEAPGNGGDITLSKEGLLHCGSYGTFRSEEELLRDEQLCEMEFALREKEDEQQYEEA